MKNSLEFYESLSDDNKQRLDKTLEDNAKFRETVENLRNENKQLKREIDVLKDQVIKITTTICTDLSC
jgi:cell division protein FtsB